MIIIMMMIMIMIMIIIMVMILIMITIITIIMIIHDSSRTLLCLCTPLCDSWTKYGTLEHNYSLLQLYKALISTASLVLRRLFGVPNSMFSFPMATMVGLPFLVNASLS